MRRQQAQHELGGLLGGQFAAVVALHQVVVAPARLGGIAGAAGAGQEVGPLVVAVQRQQGVVEVEQG
ncbi:Uncharacterised protein [Bordetella pertussis]|nr:Uncharacterised protein [Bordetella pertussis]